MKTFLEIKKRYAMFRMELQNNTITGMNSDEISLMEDNINEEVRKLAGLQPPFLHNEWHVRNSTSVTLMSGGANTMTGTADIPQAVDSASNLKYRDIFRVISDDTYRYRITDITGTTYSLDYGLKAAATTATKWTAYRDVVPLPHNLGTISNIYYEDGEIPIKFTYSRDEFQEYQKRIDTGSKPRLACINEFTNQYSDYTFSETSVSVSSSSREVTVSDTQYYNLGDNIILDTGTTESLHTIIGVSTTTAGKIHLDRKYNGASKGVTLYCNPKRYTNWMTYAKFPTSKEEVIINGWVKPQDMVYDTDVCIFPEYYIPAIIVGALIRDKIGMNVLTEQWLLYYDMVMAEMKKKPNKQNVGGIKLPNTTGTMTSQYPDPSQYDPT